MAHHDADGLHSELHPGRRVGEVLHLDNVRLGKGMPANQIIVKDRPDCLFRMNILRLIPAMRALLGKQPNILFTQFHPVWTLNDMGWVTTRAIVDELLKIDFDCLVANERSYAPVPEHAFACGLHVASQTLSLRVFDIEGKIFLAPPWEHHPPLIR